MNQRDKNILKKEASIISNEGLLKNFADCVVKVDCEAARMVGSDQNWWAEKRAIVEAEILRRLRKEEFA